MDDKQTYDTFVVGDLLPVEARMRFVEQGGGTAGMIDLSRQLVFLILSDFRPEDLNSFEAPARFRVARMRNFLILNPLFRGFSFDIVWSPFIAAATGEPEPEGVGQGDHPAWTFILTDGGFRIRGIRVATLSPETGQAILRGRRELMGSGGTPADLEREMTDLFSRYPQGLPDTIFHEICNLGD